MVRVGKQSVFVDNQAARGFARRVGVTILANRLIGRDERLDSLLNRVRLAERTHDAALFAWVLLLGGGGGYDADLACGHRPGGRILPVRIAVQDHVRIQRLTLKRQALVFSINRSRRPIHQPVRLVGGVVEKVHADTRGKPTCHRHVFFGADLAGQGDHDTKARSLRRVLVRGVHTSRAGQLFSQREPHVRRAEVDIQGQGGAAEHRAFLTPAFSQVACDEAAHVFHVGLLGVRHFQELREGFRRAVRLCEAFAQLLPVDHAVQPLGGCAPRGCGDFQLHCFYPFL